MRLPAMTRAFSSEAKQMSVSDAIRVMDKLAKNDDDVQNADLINDYFKVNFMKIDYNEARKLLEKASDAYALEDKFWVWETIEEAVRPKLYDVPFNEVVEIYENMGKLEKGSDLFKNDCLDMYLKNTKIF